MSKTVNLGGDRLGSGAKNNVSMHGYNRSNHDLSYLWKSTMAPGTLVPFMVQVGLPGDTFDIDLDSVVKTHPTIGPLFGSFKLQLDVFSCPIRLYNKELHNNKLGIGLKMGNILLPQMSLTANKLKFESYSNLDNLMEIPIEFQQINQSSLLAYLGVRGLARSNQGDSKELPIQCEKNAVPLIAYWDIFKNYYANKQEKYAYAITSNPTAAALSQITVGGQLQELVGYTPTSTSDLVTIYGSGINPDNVFIELDGGRITAREYLNLIPQSSYTYGFQGFIKTVHLNKEVEYCNTDESIRYLDTFPILNSFELTEIDKLREDILSYTGDVAFTLSGDSPYGFISTLLHRATNDVNDFSMRAIMPQSGLAVKTFQSDLFNNWINQETISGPGSISEITAISTVNNKFTIDTFILSKKVYDMLNRIATSGGSYEDWLSATYDHNSKWRAETPVYHGGLSKEIVFQEVVSQSATTDNPLGTLAGKGVMSSKHKGGHVVINVDEPIFIMGIVSITPRVDYSQGNEWFVNLTTLDDFHKPALDGIGFQDLVTDQIAFWDTQISEAGSGTNEVYRSAGKVPAWINYMTNFNKSYGNFADPRQQMFMTLNRRYQPLDYDTDNFTAISDLTTYIDPAKFNYAFADTTLSAQNFWVQIAVNCEARRKMSAKIIPNL